MPRLLVFTETSCLRIKHWTPLIWAIQKDRKWAVDAMLRATETFDFTEHTFRGRTVLHFGAEKGDIDLFQLLLEQSTPTLDINAVDRERCTALFRAAKVGDAKIVELLLRSNADPNITNTDGIDFVF